MAMEVNPTGTTGQATSPARRSRRVRLRQETG